MLKTRFHKIQTGFLITLTFLLVCVNAIQMKLHGNPYDVMKNDLPHFISSKVLKVTLDPTFPRIVQYNWLATADVIYGQEDKLSQILINGKAYTPEISFSKTKNSAQYVLTIPEINVVLNLQIKVISNIVELNVTRIAENGSFKVSTFEIPDHSAGSHIFRCKNVYCCER